MKQKSHTVYCITHIASGMQYVGITSYSLAQRWCVHVTAAKGKRKLTPIAQAISDFGKDAFSVNAIRVTAASEKAEMLERQYIRDLGTLIPLGFNSQSGGKGGFTQQPYLVERMRSVHIGRVQSQREKDYRASKLKGKRRTPEQVERSASKRRGAKRSEQFRADCRERAKRQFALPEAREKARQISIAQWLDEELRAKAVAAAIERAKSPEVRAQRLRALDKGRAIRLAKYRKPEES